MTDKVFNELCSQKLSFMNLTKFVDELKAFGKINFNDFECCNIYFEGNDTYRNKFGKLGIRPVAIEMRGSANNILITHKTLLEYFKGQPVISINKLWDKLNPADKSKIHVLKVSFTTKEYEGTPYYPAQISVLSLKRNIERIRNQRVNDETEITTNFI